jgi:hypothetical protein
VCTITDLSSSSESTSDAHHLSSNCFGCGDVTLSIPVTFPMPMRYVKKSGSCEYCIAIKLIIKNIWLSIMEMIK